MPFRDEGTVITVIYDRIRVAAGRSTREQNVLAHVLAHEIGHVLERTNRHAETGLMKARWKQDDYDAMEKKPLEFTTFDQLLIHEGLKAMKWRKSGLTADSN